MAGFEWSEPSEKAAHLVAQANLTYPEIAENVGVTRQTLWRWRNEAEFIGRVEAHLAEIREEVRRVGIAIVERRVGALNDRWVRMRRVIEERADDPALRDVPGGTTGLLARTVKGLGSGDSFAIVEEYALDAALLRELRDHEKQAAQELGQWTERKTIEDHRKAYDVTNPPDEL